MPNKCRVCSHKQRKRIDRELMSRWRSSETYRSLGKRYNLTVACLYRHLHEHIPAELWAAESTRRRLGSENLLEMLVEEANEVRKLRQACTAWLQDPEDPNRLCVDPRAEAVNVVYAELEDGIPVRKRERLDRLIARLGKRLGIAPVSWTVKHPDPGSQLIAAARAFTDFGNLIGRLKGELKDVVLLQDTQRIAELARSLIALVPAESLGEARRLVEGFEHGEESS